MPKLALVTCLDLPEPDVDQEMVLNGFIKSGLETDLVAWDDPAIDWGNYDLSVIRSTWNYPEFPAEFMTWLDYASTKTRILNEPNIVKWNIDKRYLADLESQGISIVETELINETNPHCFDRWKYEDIVIKPNIGAGSWMTKKFGPNQFEEADNHINDILKEGLLALKQPYLSSVENGGEVSLIYIDGIFTHKIVKSPRFDGDDESVSRAYDLTPEDKLHGHDAIKVIETDLLYARIDFIIQDSNYYLSELEVIEPSLFFLQNPPALNQLIQGVVRRI